VQLQTRLCVVAAVNVSAPARCSCGCRLGFVLWQLLPAQQANKEAQGVAGVSGRLQLRLQAEACWAVSVQAHSAGYSSSIRAEPSSFTSVLFLLKSSPSCCRVLAVIASAVCCGRWCYQ
jgi:hypothetical protein